MRQIIHVIYVFQDQYSIEYVLIQRSYISNPYDSSLIHTKVYFIPFSYLHLYPNLHLNYINLKVLLLYYRKKIPSHRFLKVENNIYFFPVIPMNLIVVLQLGSKNMAAWAWIYDLYSQYPHKNFVAYHTCVITCYGGRDTNPGAHWNSVCLNKWFSDPISIKIKWREIEENSCSQPPASTGMFLLQVQMNACVCAHKHTSKNT